MAGIVTVDLNENPFTAFHKQSNYKIIYLRRFGSAVMAMKKTGPAERQLSRYAPEVKKVAFEDLEDVLLEPLRAGSGKSSWYLKRTRYLPDLMGNSLESYPRRVFIDVGLSKKEGGSETDWFAKHYPMRNKDFEMYKIETVTKESFDKEVLQIGMLDWLRRNMRDDEYGV